MIRNFFRIVAFLSLIACSAVQTTSSGIKIKGRAEVLTRLINAELGSESAISGYVYSRLDSTFLESASIIISDSNNTQTDQNGLFYLELEPGEYSVKCQYIGHSNEEIKRFKIKKGEHLVVIFELGTEIVH